VGGPLHVHGPCVRPQIGRFAPSESWGVRRTSPEESCEPGRSPGSRANHARTRVYPGGRTVAKRPVSPEGARASNKVEDRRGATHTVGWTSRSQRRSIARPQLGGAQRSPIVLATHCRRQLLSNESAKRRIVAALAELHRRDRTPVRVMDSLLWTSHPGSSREGGERLGAPLRPRARFPDGALPRHRLGVDPEAHGHGVLRDPSFAAVKSSCEGRANSERTIRGAPKLSASVP
jgi:hypothetical protein